MKEIFKERKEKINFLIERGFTGDIGTGKVYNKFGKEVKSIHSKGYLTVGTSILINNKYKTISIKQHQFIYYIATGDVVECIDHINGIKTDNRINNLRSVTNQQNTFNSKSKGCFLGTGAKKWRAKITIDGKIIHLGYYDNEKKARQVYLEAKLKYHNIL